MYIILGATGHVGSAVAKKLLERGEQLTVVTHDPAKVPEWNDRGARAAVVDVTDTEGLHAVFSTGTRLFMLNPPADSAGDTVKAERATVASMLKALEGSGIQKVVAESTYGARPGEGIGDLGVLYEMERGLQATGIPVSIIRAAYYMSNWDASLKTAKEEGLVYSLYPGDFRLPMAAPADMGETAAGLLQDEGRTGIHYVEGPERYAPNDVAAAFSKALGREVKVKTIPEADWESSLRGLGFSDEAAKSMVAMTRITLEEGADMPVAQIRGRISLQQYIDDLVASGKEH